MVFAIVRPCLINFRFPEAEIDGDESDVDAKDDEDGKAGEEATNQKGFPEAVHVTTEKRSRKRAENEDDADHRQSTCGNVSGDVKRTA